ncbi:hypothetical protein RI129_010015 [Pyrocoelia pectoralis]|uniref:SIAH-type domain-containing protein n=1 Tax=Pyrocoelia pectoralis TaxID=417401 RepID=A0AAN7ZJF0_9COLE
MSSNSSSYDLPQDIVNTLLCSICDGYLSCAPVMEVKRNLICGRCDKNSTDAVLQVAYERVMSNFVFPCRFDKHGCEKRLLFNSSMEHEKQCKYRILHCPALLKIPCTSKLSACELRAHFEEHHRELISSDGQFSINLDQEARCNLLMVRDVVTIIIKYFYDHSEGCLYLKVSYLCSEDELIYYKTQIINGTDCDNSLNLPQQQCDLYESSTYLRYIYILLSHCIVNNPISGLFNMSSNSFSYDLSQDIVNTLLCSICDGYLSCGPVTEVNGDLICGRCDTNNTDAVLQVAYEKVMSNFVFPCRFDKQGCEERFLFNSSMEHEKQCKYRILHCPALLKIPCTVKLSACELRAHFEEHHRDLISSDGQFSINLDEEAHYNLLMVRDGITIIIKYFYDDSAGCLHLKVSYLYSEDELIYYKIQIINGTNCDNSLNLPQQQCDLYECSTVDSTNPLKLEMQKYLGIFGNPPSLVFKIGICFYVDCRIFARG